MIDLTAFQQLILLDAAIRERFDGHPPHGLRIKADLTEMYREAGELEANEAVNHGRLYPNIDHLVDRGLLEKSERDARTNDYRITEAGFAEIDKLQDLIAVALGEADANPYGVLPDDEPEAVPADD